MKGRKGTPPGHRGLDLCLAITPNGSEAWKLQIVRSDGSDTDANLIAAKALEDAGVDTRETLLELRRRRMVGG
ncbi:hypothetical protein [Hyphomonas adhaerens]|nr:hypothetical protein [Hyphomonas adhaerens]